MPSGTGSRKVISALAACSSASGIFGISVVAEHALVVHGANRARKVRLIVPWAHVPIAALFGIPAQGQDLKRAAACEMKIGERMISRADDEIDLFLVDIGLFAVESDLPAPLIVLAVARDHGEVTVRCLVMEWLSEFGNMFRPHSCERPSHARFPVSRREICMAARANGRVHIATFRIGRRVWRRRFV